MTLQNPLLPGFYPDPSICRVGDDYYMVASSFSYFPGVPIFHSRDLANWEQIGHVLDRPSQLPLVWQNISGGIYAPTLRWHDGIFYMITTNVSARGNFIVTAKRPEGPWSDPHWIEGAEGIDPSLFWDDDGKAYYTGNGGSGDEMYIWTSEIDLERFCLVGEKRKVWCGSHGGSQCPEAPHLYKIGGRYYLMIAEGGTEHYHSETVARADSVWGPFEGCPANPILTMRHFGFHAEIARTGHGDLVQCQDGSWWMVFLASRPYGGYHCNLGRETFIAPVEWVDGWPLVTPETGRVLFSYPGPNLPEWPVEPVPVRDDFDGEKLSYVWNYLGTPKDDAIRLENSRLKIRLTAPAMGKSNKIAQDPLGFLGRRQQHPSFRASAKLEFVPEDAQSAGLVALQHGFHQLRLELTRNTDGCRVIRAMRGYSRLTGSLQYQFDLPDYYEEVLGEIPWGEDSAVLWMEAELQSFTLSAQRGNGEKVRVAQADGSILGSETAGGFVGTYIGMFASGNGVNYHADAAFDWFGYEGK